MITTPLTPPPNQSATLLLGDDPASHRRTKSLQTFPFLSSHPQRTPPTHSHSDDDLPQKPSVPFLDVTQSGKRLEAFGKNYADDRSSTFNEINTTTPPPHSQDVSCTKIFIYTSFAISAICVFIFLGFDYIKYVLLSLERASIGTSLLVFSLLFTAVSFPLTWGYILLNVAVGYLYGLVRGVPLVMTCAICGVCCAHLVIRRCFKDCVWERLANETMRSIVRVVESGSGLKVVALARLTPIPFGLQNALFAMSNLPVHRYLMASMLGMLPSQGLHVYIGSTLRSMEEVVSANRSSSLAYCIFAAQILIAIMLLVFVLGKARLEFDRTLEEVKVIPIPQTSSSCSTGPSSEPPQYTQANSRCEDLMSNRLTLHRSPVKCTVH